MRHVNIEYGAESSSYGGVSAGSVRRVEKPRLFAVDQGEIMRFLGAMMFAGVCVGLMAYSLFLRRPSDRRDQYQDTPLRVVTKASRA